MTTNTPQTIRGAPTEPMVGLRTTGTHSISARENSNISKNPKILSRPDTSKSSTPSPSLALECKCAFGATSHAMQPDFQMRDRKSRRGSSCSRFWRALPARARPAVKAAYFQEQIHARREDALCPAAMQDPAVFPAQNPC